MRRPAPLAAALFALASLGAPDASADIAVPGVTHVPLELTLEGQAAFADAEFVVVQCNSADGRHIFGFPRGDAPLACKTKNFPVVYALPKKEVAELRALVAKDLGWGTEYGEGQKVLEAKGTKCGEINEPTYLEDKLGVTKVVGRYAVEKDASGKCSLRKVSWTQVKGAPPTNAASAPSTPALPAPSPPANNAPASRSGGCALASHLSPDPWPLLLALGLGAARLRRSRRPVLARQHPRT